MADTDTRDSDTVGRPRHDGRRIGDFVRWDTVVGAVLVVVLLLSFGTVSDFANTLNIAFLIGNALPIAFIALPMCMLVAAGEIDLSVGSMVGLSGSVMGYLWNDGWSIQAIIPLCLLVGVAGGLLNGLLVTRLGLPSLAVTIGTLAAYRGLAQIILGANAVTDFPQQYLDFGSGTLGGSPIPQAAVLYVVLLAVAVFVLHQTSFGRGIFAIGASADAAFFAGLRVKRTKLIVFVATGVMASFTGVFWALHYASARYDNATGLELSVVAAVLLGGVDFNGGRGTIGGVFAGVFLLGTLQNVMSLLNISSDTQTIVTGILLVISVLGPRLAAPLAAMRASRAAAKGRASPSPA